MSGFAPCKIQQLLSDETLHLVETAELDTTLTIHENFRQLLGKETLPEGVFLGFDVFTTDYVHISEPEYLTRKPETSGLICVIPPKEPGSIALALTVLSIGVSVYAYNNLSATSAPDPGSSSSIYDANLQGNQVKLGQVVPEHFGRVTLFPDLICPPWKEYVPLPDNKTGVRTHYALCLGRGRMDKASNLGIKLGNTTLTELADGSDNIEFMQPNVAMVGDFGYNWYNIPEIGGIGANSGVDLTAQDAIQDNYSVWYTLAPTDVSVSLFAIDFRCPEGLATLDSNGDVTGSFSLNFTIEIRTKDNIGPVTTTSVTLSQSTLHEYGKSVLISSASYSVLSSFKNLEIRLVNTTAYQDSLRYREKVSIAGIRSRISYIDPTTGVASSRQTVYPEVTTLFFDFIASESMGTLESNKISVPDVNRYYSVNTPVAGITTYGSPFTASIGNAFQQLLYTLGHLEKLDQASLLALEGTWDTLNWEFNGTIDSASTFETVAKAILGIGHGELVDQFGTYRVVGDFSKSVTKHIGLGSQTAKGLAEYYDFTPDPYDGWEIEYFDMDLLAQQTLLYPAQAETFLNPKRLTPKGITNATQAYQYMHRLRATHLLTQTFKVGTELSASGLAYLDWITVSRGTNDSPSANDVFTVKLTKVTPSTTGVTLEGVLADPGIYAADTYALDEVPDIVEAAVPTITLINDGIT